MNIQTQFKADRRTDRETHLARAAKVLPGGASASGRRVFHDVIVKTQGAYLWNSGGKRFIDYLLDYGPIVIGHSDPRVNDAAAQTAATCDLNWVGAHPAEVELAEAIVRLVPSAEKVAFVTSGSDALLHAVHVARQYTGRRKILKFHGSFVGWQDALAKGANFDVQPNRVPGPQDANSGGISLSALEEVLVVDWNDFSAVRTAFDEAGSEIACIVCEPYVLSYGCVTPAPGFLSFLREISNKQGALLIFDEVKTGFRLHLGGFQSVEGVTPDLTALGKSMANGYTTAALAGRSDLMEMLGVEVSLDGTHYANPYALSAALETIRILENGGMQRLAMIGERLRNGLTRAARDSGVQAVVTGFGSAFMVNWLGKAPVTFRDAARADFARAEAFRTTLLRDGILMPPFVITDARLCLATTEDDVDETIAIAAGAFRSVA
ncbi:MAG: aminotransferase class III-fold pyridoxal phosphate-dependent enzyme [Silicimonas sp.]|nr:aminotransferase class III-fold pyridoxal phosphate-dependent enzyme [Silicimonas sp.]